MAEALVLAPGGPRRRSSVRVIAPDHSVRAKDNRLQHLDGRGHVMAEFAAAPIAAERLPVGQKLGDDWILGAYWQNATGTPISVFKTIWTVPPPPSTKSPGQLVYLFNGMVPAPSSQVGSPILQPVLQCGVSGTGGGPFWSTASWFVPPDASNQPAFSTPALQVSPGDLLTGTMTLVARYSRGFTYRCEFEGRPGTALVVQDVPELVMCWETLEVYGLTKCTDYPNAQQTAMTSISIQIGGGDTPAVTWTPAAWVTDCGQNVGVVDPAEVDLRYRA